MFEKSKSTVTKRCHCDACGEFIPHGEEDRIQVVMPWQKRGVNYHENCLKKFVVADNKEKDNTSIGSSANCGNHAVEISHLDTVRFQYFIHYGFKKLGFGKVICHFENAESIGSTIYVAFESGATVKVDGVEVKSLKEYDFKTKEICMRD